LNSFENFAQKLNSNYNTYITIQINNIIGVLSLPTTIPVMSCLTLLGRIMDSDYFNPGWNNAPIPIEFILFFLLCRKMNKKKK